MKLNCADAITVLTGSLCVPVGRLYEIYNGLTQDKLFTHQLPRAFHACCGPVSAELPQMAAYLAERKIAPSNYLEVIEETRSIFGDSFEVSVIAGWNQIDPLEEAVDMVGADRVIGVQA